MVTKALKRAGVLLFGSLISMGSNCTHLDMPPKTACNLFEETWVSWISSSREWTYWNMWDNNMGTSCNTELNCWYFMIQYFIRCGTESHQRSVCANLSICRSFGRSINHDPPIKQTSNCYWNDSFIPDLSLGFTPFTGKMSKIYWNRLYAVNSMQRTSHSVLKWSPLASDTVWEQ